MFLAHPPGKPAVVVADQSGADQASWLDLIDPSEEERMLASTLTGLRIPSRLDLEEIENSSRLYVENGTFYLSTPLVRRTGCGSYSSPVGFVLNRDRLITLRFAEFPTFEAVARRLSTHDEPHRSEAVMLLLLEAIVDRLADVLEHVGGELDLLSARIFHAEQSRQNNADRALRELLRRVGTAGDLISQVRDSLLGLGRIGLYLRDSEISLFPEGPARLRLSAVGSDISSLNDYVAQVSNKVQFLLDATLGFINIQQNNGIKVLTVVSIVGIPPTLIASIYGMNFKSIPELNWSFGYYYALALMAATIVLPLIWFWRKGWLVTS